MFSSKDKCCLTCEHWNGKRKLLFQGKEAASNMSNDSGKCGNRTSIKFGKLCPAGYAGCNKHSKWSELK